MPCSKLPKLVLGPGVVARTGEVIVSSDHLLGPGGEFDALDMLRRLVDAVESDERIRSGTRRGPDRNEVKLSLRLRTELVRLCLRGR